ncbi:hypothetical protein C4N9_04365 [Pararhodobacter marinus]|uniref:Sulfotransferase family protein n=1 Tax=Pararhodobacter marinus TaxID=2184063 RepID=A0A2U2CGJ2_9RHOB|nr:hypothetical protein [Pararhodobacter marinus]PWE30990.1 hypothetical protein C4N9_04365 [Pararhodobacter marinus]
MEIAFHLGAHCTDRDALVQCLMRNRATLLEQGIAVPGPGRYRQQLRQIAFDMRERETSAETQEILLDGILDEDEVDRVVFSSENLLSMPPWVVNDGQLYHAAADRAAMIRHLFPEARLEFFLAIRNPATLLPALAAGDSSGALARRLAEGDPGLLRWSDMLARVTEAVPDVPITIWCDEDTPLLWPEILRAVSGHAPDTVLEGWLAWYWDLVTPRTHAAMRRWFDRNPPADDAARRKMLGVLLSRFVKEDAVAPDPLIPGWTGDTIERLTEIYEADIDLAASIPGVTLLEP